MTSEMDRHDYLSSIAVYKTGIFSNKRQLVIVPAYNTEGKFGYFLVYEQIVSNNRVTYSDELYFVEKTDEFTSYQQIFDYLQQLKQLNLV